MKNFGKLIGMVGFIGFMGAGIAFAQTNAPGIQQRMENQQRRIEQGVESGALTPRETGRLEAEQARIKQTEERMKADGNLTSPERQRLNQMQDKASSDIYREKHDRQTVNVGQNTGNVNDPGIQQRMENQQRRIDQGVASGSLTPREAGRLEANQAQIKQTEERMKADGNLTPKERQKLNKMQDNASKRIYQQKHDRQKAPVR
jgi:phosphosulfolactate synthase (CoM biosynthesis protein A)